MFWCYGLLLKFHPSHTIEVKQLPLLNALALLNSLPASSAFHIAFPKFWLSSRSKVGSELVLPAF